MHYNKQADQLDKKMALHFNTTPLVYVNKMEYQLYLP